MINIFKIIYLLLPQKKNRGNPEESQSKLKITPLELHLDNISNKPFVVISPKHKYVPHKCYIEDLIEDKILLPQLDFNSIKYLFYIYGMLRVTEKNTLYIVEEFLWIDKQIRVKNLNSLQSEVWNKSIYEKKYLMLEKKLIKPTAEFFHLVQDEQNDNHELTLVK